MWITRDRFATNPVAPRLGRDLVIESTSPFVNGVLSQINVFALWHAVVFAVGLHACAGVSRWLAVGTVALVWTVLLSLQVIGGSVIGR